MDGERSVGQFAGRSVRGSVGQPDGQSGGPAVSASVGQTVARRTGRTHPTPQIGFLGFSRISKFFENPPS